jgi:hypothetical protein
VEANGATTTRKYEAKTERLTNGPACGANAIRAADPNPASTSQYFRITSRRVSIVISNAADFELILLLK